MTVSWRCSHCLMPVETGRDGAAVVHDFPYAVHAYGQCKGSCRPALAGPGTPPAVWALGDGLTYVELGVLPSPVPRVERDGWTTLITGVRFDHSTHCWKCRKGVAVATDGGTIQIGFDSRGRAFEKLRPGGRAAYSGPCPHGCGQELELGSPRSEASHASPVADGCTVQACEWERLRRDLGVWTVNMTRADLARLRRTVPRTR